MSKIGLALAGIALLAAAIPACAKAGKGKEKIRRVLRESCPFLNLKSSRTSNASFTVSNMGV